VKGACDHVEMGSLTGLLEKIQPAVEEETSTVNDRTSGNAEFVEKVEAINVHHSVEEILKRSPILKELVETGACGIVGGTHDISTGRVEFYQDTKLGFSRPIPDVFKEALKDLMLPSGL
jgi:carbonic anhydrase